MMPTTVEKFWTIVEEEMAGRDIRSYRALEKLGGVANGTISQRARTLMAPTPTTIGAIAIAMDIPDAIVREWAGGRRPPEKKAVYRQILHLFAQLPEELQHAILIQMRAWIEEQEDAPIQSGVPQPANETTS